MTETFSDIFELETGQEVLYDGDKIRKEFVRYQELRATSTQDAIDKWLYFLRCQDITSVYDLSKDAYIFRRRPEKIKYLSQHPFGNSLQ